MIRTLMIADSQPICIRALRAEVEKIDGAIHVTASDSFAAVEAALDDPALAALVLGLRLDDSPGLVNLSQVRNRRPDLAVLVLDDGNSAQLSARVHAMGARGYLSKRAPLEQVRAALSVVIQGGQWFAEEAQPGKADITRLSPAQTRVMLELAHAQPNKLIARKLNLSEATVKSHLSAVYRALGVSNRSQAMLALREMGN